VHRSEGFFSSRAHPWKRKRSICLEEFRSEVFCYWRVISRAIAPFCSIDTKGIPLGLFYLAQKEFLKEGTTPIENIHRFEGNFEGFYSNLLHSYSRTPDLQFEGLLESFGGHSLGGQNIELSQPIRAVPIPDPSFQGRTISRSDHSRQYQ
jgi:hypothetical protein